MDEAGKILIVDDDAMTVKLCTMALKRDEYETKSAADGRQGLETALEWEPDVVLLDVMMPKLDGYEVCERLRADERTRGIPIIMITVKDESSDVARGLDAGADDYVKKPFSTRELVARVRAAMRRKRVQDALRATVRGSFAPSAAAAEEKAGISPKEVAGYVHNMALCLARQAEASASVEDASQLQAAMQRIGELSRHVTETTAGLVEGGLSGMLQRELLDVSRPLNKAVALVEPYMRGLGVAVEPWAGDQVMIVLGDGERLTEVFVTLMMNAQRAAPSKGAGRLVLRVTASGNQCYVAFHSGPREPGSIEGSEYGMRLVREIVEAHGGSVAQERTQGDFVRYVVRLPIAKA